jgi:putative methyltransferase (TIGR04325 family)
LIRPSAIFRDLTPPLLRRWANRLHPSPITYSGPFGSWDAAAANASGYDAPTIVSRVSISTRAVLDAEATYEQDGMAFKNLPPPPSPSLSGLLLAAACDGGRLSVLDFGGALGSHYLRWRHLLAALPNLAWSVVEQPAFVEAAYLLYQNHEFPLRFHTEISQCSEARPNAVLASSVLQYLVHPVATLRALMAVDAKVLVLDRTPFARDDISRVLVQRVSPKLYQASYPLQTLSRKDIAAVLLDRYELLQEFASADSSITLRGADADYRGAIWVRKN